MKRGIPTSVSLEMQNMHEKQAFNGGEKHVAIISEAASRRISRYKLTVESRISGAGSTSRSSCPGPRTKRFNS